MNIWVRRKRGDAVKWEHVDKLRPDQDVSAELAHYRLHYPKNYFTAAVKRPTTWY